MAKKKIAIVVSDFNDEITRRMEKKARDAAKENDVEVVKVVHVPGAYDMPIIVSELAGRDDVEGVVALGAIIKGETKHDEIISIACAKMLSEISVKHGKPVGFGVIGPGVSYDKARARAEIYAKRAVEAVVKLIDAKNECRKQEG
ncbi:MAG: 6,7-dimethyl-8-ribityllumazine synthase [Candidatus Micrarchaeota archaeon]